LTININRSKAKRTHFINAYVKTNLPQLKKVYLIIWLSGFWALENSKGGVVVTVTSANLQPQQFCNLSKFASSAGGSKNSICQNRVENLILIILGLFPDEKYSILTILDHF
jgi:hypothetical protein